MKTPWWFLHKTPIAFLLLPFAWIYYLISRSVFLCRKMFTYKSRRTIICVGGILAGGVGKTPVVRQIANFLDAPVVMRGYKKTAKTGNVGDEATMLANDGISVHVGDRKSNIILLNKQKDNTPIVMDDGFQNPLIHKDISILVFDEFLGVGNGFLLPAGPLREPMSHVANVDAIIVIKSEYKKKKFSVPANVPVFYAENKTVSPFKNNQSVVAFAGIDYPKKFFKMLTNVVAHRAYPDHYQYTDKDIEHLIKLAGEKKAKLITTEKDWVRLPKYAREKVQYAKLETKIDDAFFDWLKEKLNANAKKNS